MPDDKKYDRFSWIRTYGDLELDAENQAARKRGYDDDYIRRLIASVCLQACTDYKKALRGKRPDSPRSAEYTIKECERFFDGPIFQGMVPGVNGDEVAEILKRTPETRLNKVWKSLAGFMAHEKDKVAIETQPIIEE